ncbi:MAG: alanine dehydrogenase [Myxococcota bacterium]|jgi:alanine dehydrogenase
MQTLILTRADVEALATMETVVPAVEAAFHAHGNQQTLMPPKVYLPLPQHHGDFRAMPAYMDAAAGVKWVNSHPENPARYNLPAVMGVYILSDPETARPLCIMDGTWLTALRTGAAAAVASKYLARASAQSIGFVGAGVQSYTLLEAHRVTHPDISRFVVADLRPDAALALAKACGGRVGSVAEAAACDIVCTTTPSSTPVVRRADVADGAHINAMGADAEGKQELETAILLAAYVVVDDPAQALHSGEVNVPVHQGDFAATDIAGTLGEVVTGRIAGRTSDATITVFDSTGLAIQDLAVAKAVYERALAEGVGISVPLVG